MQVSFRSAQFERGEGFTQAQSIETVFANYCKCLVSPLKPRVNEQRVLSSKPTF